MTLSPVPGWALDDAIGPATVQSPGYLVSDVLPVVTINHQDDLGLQLYFPVCLTLPTHGRINIGQIKCPDIFQAIGDNLLHNRKWTVHLKDHVCGHLEFLGQTQCKLCWPIIIILPRNTDVPPAGPSCSAAHVQYWHYCRKTVR